MKGLASDERNPASLPQEKDNCLDLAALCSGEHRVFIFSERISRKVQHGFDPVTALVKKKGAWWKQYKTKVKMLSKIQASMDELKEKVKGIKENTCITLPEHTMKLVKYMGTDPDQFFWGRYNWYYTGGTLCHLKCQEQDLLLYTKGIERDTLCLSQLKSLPYWQATPSGGTNEVCPEGGCEIFQVLGREMCEQVVVGSRQKHNCSFYVVEDITSSESLSRQQSIHSRSPFTSFDFSPHSKHYCTVDTAGLLKVWDLTRRKSLSAKYQSKIKSVNDNWRNVRFSLHCPPVVLLADRKSLISLDVRCNKENNIVQLSEGSELHSEEPSFVCPSEHDPYVLYMGTSSNLVMFDVRNLQAAVKKSFHNMSSPPLYCTTVGMPGDREMVCIANQYPGSVQIACNSKDSTFLLKEALSHTESLLSYQARGTCLDPSIGPRICQSLTGLTCLYSDNTSTMEILTQTSATDVFAQSVFKRQDNCLGHDFNVLAGPSKTLEASDRWDLTNLYKGLRKERSFRRNIKKKRRVQKWHLSEMKLFSYQDALSCVILDAWDIEEPKDAVAVDIRDNKVSAWLENIGANGNIQLSQESNTVS